MRQFVSTITLTLLALSAMVPFASAQDDGENSEGVPFGQAITAELAAQLPIEDDVQYQVGVADTADEIAALFDVSLTCLIEGNELENPNFILVGETLQIDADCPPYVGLNYVPFPRSGASASDSGSAQTYVVRPADTLDEIAFAFDVSLDALIDANEIEEPGQILPGQAIEIPDDAPPYNTADVADTEEVATEVDGGVQYVVQPTDTLDTIGAFYGASIACIAETNGVDNPLLLQPRTVLFISSDCPPYVGAGISNRGRIITDSESNIGVPVTEAENIIETLETLTEQAESDG